MTKPADDGRPIDQLHAINARCRWCPMPLVIINGVIGCAECDNVARWPVYWR